MSLTKLRPKQVTPGFELEPSTPNDRYFDYCLEPYRPRRPTAGRLRSENLLWHSLEVGGASEHLREPLLAVKTALGHDMTVWGVKFDGKRLWWELYFYDPRKDDASATIGNVARTLSPWIPKFPATSESIPYIMASFDISRDIVERGEVPAVNLYLHGTNVQEGRSYRITSSSRELDNTYRFLEAKREIDQILPLLKSSVFVDYSESATLSKVLIPELFGCKKICVAKKRNCDAIYFSGIAVDQLLWFLLKFEYPAPLLRFVEEHSEQFEHLYFDVGIDYLMNDDREIVYLKTSYYGTL